MISLDIAQAPPDQPTDAVQQSPPIRATGDFQHYSDQPPELAEDWRWAYGSHTLSVDGQPMNPEERRAMNLSAVWRATSVIANTIAMLPATVRRRTDDGRGWTAIPDHPVAKLLRRPGRGRGGYMLRQTMQKHAILRGNAYAEILSGGMRGWAYGLRFIHTDRIQPYDMMDDGRLRYWFFPHRGPARQVVEGDDVLHVRGLSDDGVTGISVLEMMRRSVETGEHLDEFGRRFFRQAPIYRGVVQVPWRMDPKDRKDLRDAFNKDASGRNNWFTAKVLERGMTWHSIGVSNEDSQWLESRQFTIPDFARWIGTPVVLLMHTDRSSVYANAGKFFESLIKFDLASWITGLEQQYTDTLILPAEQDMGIEVDLNTDAILRGDPAARAAFYKVMTASRIMTRNEVRALEGLNPVDGGDEFDPPKTGGAPGMTPGGGTGSADDDEKAGREADRKDE